MKDFHELILENTAKAFNDYFMNFSACHPQYGINWFFGGSFRFRYITSNSDLDVFMYCRKPSQFIDELCHMGFQSIPNTYYPGTKSLSLCNKERKIHLNIIADIGIYTNLSQEHDMLTTFLLANPILLNMARAIKKRRSMKGSHLYILLMDIMKKKPVSFNIKTAA